MIVHIVLFQFHEKNKQENIQKIKMMLEALSEKIDALQSIEIGVDFSREARSYDMSLLATFETKENLAVYAAHPEHQEVLEVIKQAVHTTKVVDYEK
jgi:hypothetical protein